VCTRNYFSWVVHVNMFDFHIVSLKYEVLILSRTTCDVTNSRQFFVGWDSLEKQNLGPTNWMQKRAYSTWKTTWCAYTSSSAVAHPLGGTRMDVS